MIRIKLCLPRRNILQMPGSVNVQCDLRIYPMKQRLDHARLVTTQPGWRPGGSHGQSTPLLSESIDKGGRVSGSTAAKALPLDGRLAG
jgi:hypothetical protein